LTSSLLIPNCLRLRLRLVNKTVESTSLKTNAETVAIVAARAADDKQGSNILVLNVGDVLAITEMFVVVSASNSRQLRTIANEVTAKIREESDRPLLRSEGMAEQQWVLLDYGDVVVHIFSEDIREFYEIERLYQDVPVVDWQASA
jgi:ribosome-associated protein